MNNKCITLLAVAGLLAFTCSAAADNFDDQIRRAKEAKERGDTEVARQALAAAEAALAGPSTDPMASQPSAPSASVATPTPAVEEDDRNILQRLSDRGFRLQLGPGKGGAAAPASFAFSDDLVDGSGTQFSAAFLLGYSPNSEVQGLIDLGTGDPVRIRRGATELFGKQNTTWTWDMSVQGNLQPGNDGKADAWVFRFGGDIDHTNPSELVTSRRYRQTLKELRLADVPRAERIKEARRRLSGDQRSFYQASWWSFAAKLEADKDFDNQRASFELTVTPSFAIPGNGFYWPSITSRPNAPWRFIWNPEFGLDAGGQVASDGTIDPVDDTLRLSGRLIATLSFDAIAKALGLARVTLSVDDKAHYLTESSLGFNYLDSQLGFWFNDEVGFAFKYVNGEQPPNFIRTESVSGALTLKF